MKRTHYCGAIRKEHMGQTATLCGWVQNRRDMGGVIFLDVKDREGVAQVVCNMQFLPPEDFHHAETLHMQSVIQVEGEIRHRDEETYNPRLATGEVELLAKRLVVLSERSPCRTRWTKMRKCARNCGSSTAIWICAVRSCRRHSASGIRCRWRRKST